MSTKVTMPCPTCSGNRVAYRLKGTKELYTHKGLPDNPLDPCRTCVRASSNNRAQRKITTSFYTFNINLDKYHTSRACKKCANKLERSRWWYCTLCNPELGEDLVVPYNILSAKELRRGVR